MLDNKFLFTLIGLIIAVIAICKSDFSSNKISENFWSNSVGRSIVANQTATTNGKVTALPLNIPAMMGRTPNPGINFFQPVNLDASIAPRFGNVQYGANIRYNMPSSKNLAVPCNPIPIPVSVISKMATNNYTKENYGCENKNDSSLPQISEDSNYVDALNSPNYSASLPISDMSVLSSDGTVSNVIISNQLTFANKKNRLWGLADLIRGDLAIAPCTGNWFQVSANPATGLNAGALASIGGYDNESMQNTVKLIHAASGNTNSTMAGMDLSSQLNQVSNGNNVINMVPNINSSVSNQSGSTNNVYGYSTLVPISTYN